MRFLRWLLGIAMLLLLFVIRERITETHSPRIIRPEFKHTSLQDRDYVYYTIQPGDTIATVERKFRVSSRESILELNPKLNADDLPVNEQIKIPLE